MKSATCREYRIICFTDRGLSMLHKVFDCLRDQEKEEIREVSSLTEWTKESFCTGNILIFIGACGIAVRAIAPFIKDKMTDPAVLVMDEGGEFVIPLLSGHLGGAVDAAHMLAEKLGSRAVVTTATDTRGLFAVDVFAKENGLVISDREKAKEYSAVLLKSGSGFYGIDPKYEAFFSDYELPEEIKKAKGEPYFLISPGKAEGDVLQLIPRVLVAGMGCRKGKSFDELYGFVKKQFMEKDLDLRAVKALVSIDRKAEEPGLLELAEKLGVPFITFDAKRLMAVEGDFLTSDYVKEVTGADNVCDRAVRAYGAAILLIEKAVENGMTLSVGICPV